MCVSHVPWKAASLSQTLGVGSIRSLRRDLSHACAFVSGIPQKCTQQVKITVRDYEEAKQARMAAEDKARDLHTQNEAMDTQMHKLQRVSHIISGLRNLDALRVSLKRVA
jgi:hypothetical protein